MMFQRWTVFGDFFAPSARKNVQFPFCQFLFSDALGANHAGGHAGSKIKFGRPNLGRCQNRKLAGINHIYSESTVLEGLSLTELSDSETIFGDDL